MKWIALTGGIAMGKSRVCRMLVESGHPVVHADAIVHSLLGPRGAAVSAVAQVFGRDFVTVDQAIDRRKLGAQVFKNSSQLRTLENILHPLVQAEAENQRRELERAGHPVAFYEIPLLFEKGLQKNFDAIVVVTAPAERQRQWLATRDRLSDAEIDARLGAQMPIAVKVQGADVVIDNSGDEAHLEREVMEKILRRYQAQT
jgi:dephospho-CoA kinase